MIKFINVTKYLHEDMVLENFNYEIKKNDFVIFTGINSDDVLKMIYALDKLYEGDIFVANQNVKYISLYEKGNMLGYVKYDAPAVDYISVEDNLKLIYYAHHESDKEFKEILYKLTYNTPLFNRFNKKLCDLSSIEKLYFVFVRGIIDFPEIVLLENFYAREMHDYIVSNIKYLKEMGITIVMSLSNIHHVYYFDEIDKRVVKL